ncbi:MULTISPECIES: Lrp/AsnC family transcriptional regulator [unclassified Leucobacter]|uniref:Lrp/AsnC family transcriptional regulator n=1 Tax=unclassified Leucobacter TaxID=2621730 RepID=UPI00165E37DC|nr:MULTISPECIES: Lrp/AsnC family transcriptional regulator [unclassified Leucobacter]MBC9928617.1 Lrp/AsnC family transcriptional regulator [Leucobacter sp. cx-169]MBC9937548.1 Lrp/AsnC family transcriptional regulator [Leucobacter sp. cx-87]
MAQQPATVERQIDRADREIIDQLRVDGRRPFSEIGRNIGLSEPTVRQRYNRLVSMGVLHVVGMHDETKLGGISAHIGIRVSGAAVARVAEQLVDHPQIKYIACTLGYYDILLSVETPDAQALGRVVLHDIRRIHGVSEVETLTVLEMRKDTYLWSWFNEAHA